MIHWFEVSNFLSFAEPTRIDFTPGKVVDDYTIFEAPSGVRLNKFCAIFGPNASGKTNLVRALGQAAAFIARSFRAGEDAKTPFVPHFFEDARDATFTIQFEVPRTESELPADDGARSDIFRYEVVANPAFVIRETLKRKTSHLFSRVFDRIRDGENYQYTGLPDRYTRELPGNVSLVSWLARQDVPIAVRLRTYFSSVSGHVAGNFGPVPSFLRTHSAIDVYRKAPDHHQKMVELLRRWDFGLDDVNFVKRRFTGDDGKEGEYWEARVLHCVGDKKATLSLLSESNGTIELFSSLSVILEALKVGGVAIIDEIDEALHTDMVEALLDLFLRKETNPHNAQLIFTSHGSWIMDFLNKWQIVLVEKRDGRSQAWRLSDMSGVENRENHSARYRSGAYGAIPRNFGAHAATVDEEQ